jgi:enterochelin esterase family protein
LVLRFADPDERYAAVRLCSDLPPRDYERHDGEWRLELIEPPVARLEYKLELIHADGDSEWVLDPANPHRAPGAFGEKSELQLEGYEPPGWLGEEGVPGRYDEVAADVRVWAPEDAGADEELPLLVAHDGPEYDELSRLTHFLAVSIARGTLPRHRAALLAPGARNDMYSASARYADMLVRRLLPSVGEAVAVDGARVAGMGASLGGLAMLHAQRRHPRVFGALFLQSGSFFTPRYDAHEVRFSRYRRVVRFVREVLVTRTHHDPVPVVLTCGSAEENVHNNRLMATTLAGQGYPAVLHEVPDMHNYTAWRDAFDPYLPELLARAW